MQNDEWLGQIPSRKSDLSACEIANLATRKEETLRVFESWTA